MRVEVKDVKKPKRYNITIFGAGSVGSFLAFCLSKVSRNVVIVDPDNFEPHNIGTHFISVVAVENTSDIPKVVAVKKTIDEFPATCRVHCYQCRGEELKPDRYTCDTDIYIIATDTVRSRIDILSRLLDEFDRSKKKITVIDCGISEDGFIVIAMNSKDDVKSRIDSLFGKSERAESTEKACEEIRNFPVILALTCEVMKLIAEV